MSENILHVTKGAISEIIVAKWPAYADSIFNVTPSEHPEQGHVATNVAMVLAKKAETSPMVIAQEIAVELTNDDRRIEIKKPGFINIFFSNEFLARQLPSFLASLGKPLDPSLKKEKILIEHTNVNPNKAMHVGHLRNAILGDVINNVLKRAGYTTEVQYYVDDTGVQVADAALAYQLFIEKKLNKYIDVAVAQGVLEAWAKFNAKETKFDQFCWKLYSVINDAYELHPELLDERKKILHQIEDQSSEKAHALKEFAQNILADHLVTMHAFSISYDLLTWESDILGFHFWNKALTLLKGKGAIEKEAEGKNADCWIVKSEDVVTDDKYSPDKILVKSDGTVTYTGKDIAYHLWKFDLLGADFLYKEWPDAPQEQVLLSTATDGTKRTDIGHANRVYNVIDVRQAYPQGVVKDVLAKMGYMDAAANLRHVSYGVVSLSKKTVEALGFAVSDDKAVYSMSGRKGLGISVDELLHRVEQKVTDQKFEVNSARGGTAVSSRDVAVAAIKYFMLRYNPQTDIVFDYDDAMSLQGNTGPYVQYAHARAAAILGKSDATYFPMPGAVTFESAEEQLLLKLVLWPAVLSAVSAELNVNELTTYAFELANLFNSFYEACPVLKAEGAVREQRLAIVAAYKKVLADVLSVLGIVAPEQM